MNIIAAVILTLALVSVYFTSPASDIAPRREGRMRATMVIPLITITMAAAAVLALMYLGVTLTGFATAIAGAFVAWYVSGFILSFRPAGPSKPGEPRRSSYLTIERAFRKWVKANSWQRRALVEQQARKLRLPAYDGKDLFQMMPCQRPLRKCNALQIEVMAQWIEAIKARQGEIKKAARPASPVRAAS
jgi:uncharacterized membrane protein (GlpM family)